MRKTSVRAVAAYEVLHTEFEPDPELVARMRADVEAEVAGVITRALDEVRGTGPESPTWTTSRWRAGPPTRSWARPAMRS